MVWFLVGYPYGMRHLFLIALLYQPKPLVFKLEKIKGADSLILQVGKLCRLAKNL